MSLCEALRDDCGELWQALHDHPFLRELADGTLAPDRFRFYVEQDLFFLPELARAVALGVATAGDDEEMRHFAEEMVSVAESEIVNNRDLLERVLELGAPDRGGGIVAAPATVAYSGFLVATAHRGGPVEIMASLLPCTWSYADIAVGLRDVRDHLAGCRVHDRQVAGAGAVGGRRSVSLGVGGVGSFGVGHCWSPSSGSGSVARQLYAARRPSAATDDVRIAKDAGAV